MNRFNLALVVDLILNWNNGDWRERLWLNIASISQVSHNFTI